MRGFAYMLEFNTYMLWSIRRIASARMHINNK